MALSIQTIQTTIAPTNGVDEVVSLAITGAPEGGTFTITFGGATTAAIAYNATAAQVQAALVLLSSIGAGNVVCAGGALPGSAVTITGAGDLSGLNLGTFTSTDSLTGGTVPATGFTVTTSGVKGSYRGAKPGTALISTTGVGFIYTNTGTAAKPTWTESDV
jgi:hypothetical protein